MQLVLKKNLINTYRKKSFSEKKFLEPIAINYRGFYEEGYKTYCKNSYYVSNYIWSSYIKGGRKVKALLSASLFAPEGGKKKSIA